MKILIRGTKEEERKVKRRRDKEGKRANEAEALRNTKVRCKHACRLKLEALVVHLLVIALVKRLHGGKSEKRVGFRPARIMPAR